MKILNQHFTVKNEEEEILYEFDRTHLYAETGYLVKKGSDLNQGTHIELGTHASADEYEEVPGTEHHTIPESLPDMVIVEYEDDSEGIYPDENEATAEDYEDALEELGVDLT